MQGRKYIYTLFYLLLGRTILSSSLADANTDPETELTVTRNLRGPTYMPTADPVTYTPKIVLYIYADDFRNELIDVTSQARLPNLRSLQQRGITFQNAITSQPICGPSRNIMRSGVRHPNVYTFDQSYHSLGYISDLKLVRDVGNAFTVDVGKVMHFYPSELPAHLLYNNNETSAPNPIVTNGNSDCPKNQIACTIPLKQSSDTQVTIATKNMLQTCVQRLNSGKSKTCFVTVGFKHSHVEWAAYKKFSYSTHVTNTSSPIIDFDGYKYLLRHKACYDELSSYSLGNSKIISGKIKTPDQVASIPSLMQKLYGSYLNALEGVDLQIGMVMNYLDTLMLDDGTPLVNSSLVAFTADHGFSLGEETLFCKRNAVAQAAQVPLVVAWHGVTPQGQFSPALVSSEDLFCTVLEVQLGKNFMQTFVHPSGIKPTCTSLVPLLKNPNTQVRAWSFSSVYRCEDPSITEMTNPCTSDDIKPCTRPPIIWAGHSAVGIYNGQVCTYTGWWPWHEIRNCGRETWYNQPAILANYGVTAWQIDLFNSGTIFFANGKAVSPIQQELLCHGATYKRGEGNNPNTNNLIHNPAYVNFVAQAVAQIVANNQVHGGSFPWAKQALRA